MMFHFIFKTSLTHHHHHQTFLILRSLTTTTPPTPTLSVIDYLTSTLGFSPEAAFQLTQKITTTTNPTQTLTTTTTTTTTTNNNNNLDSFHSLFQNYGFTPTHIAKIITHCPSFLLSNPEKTLKPKLDFLSGTGISGPYLVTTITTNPRILQRSLHRQIAPCIAFLHTFLGSTSAVIAQFSAVRGTAVVLKYSPSMPANAKLLQKHRVPHCNIVKMLARQPVVVARDTARFSKAVREAEELGLDPESMMFIHGVCTLSAMSKDKWVLKFEVFKSFGWSEADCWALFIKQPPLMRSSEARLRKALEFFVKKMGWSVLEISMYPTVLSLSFENRVLPRWSIMEFLIGKGLVTKRTAIAKGFMLSEDNFVNVFLKRYEKHVPKVLEMYRKKLKD